MPAFPCVKCNRNVGKRHRAVCCDICNRWVHIKCNLINPNDYKKLQNDPSPFYCIQCTTTTFPFGNITDNEFYSIATKGILLPGNNPSSISSPLSPQVLKHINDLNNHLSKFSSDDDEDNISPINCKYYEPFEFDKANFNSKKSFSIFHLNIHSIQKHIDTLRALITTLETDKFQFDIIAITESKLKINCESTVDINIENYHSPESAPSEANKGGVLIYVNKIHNYKPRTDLNIYESKLLESFFVEIINPKRSNDVIGAVYRHPSMSLDHFNDNHMRSLITSLSREKNKNIHLAGDFNVNLLNFSNHSHSAEFFDIMCSNHLLPSISLPTKINTNTNTLIDNIFTNTFNPDTISGNLTLNISDGHLPSFIIIPKPNQNHLPKHHNIYKRNTKNFNPKDPNFPNQVKLMSDELKNIDWNAVMEISKNDANISFNNWWSKLDPIIDKFMPLEKITNKEYKRKFKPWITTGLVNSMKRRDKLLRQYINAKNATAKLALSTQYKLLRNQIVELTKVSKNNFYKKYFSTNNTNLKKVWTGIKSLINIKNKNNNIPSSILEDGEIITDQKKIANSFAKTYSSVADKILNQRNYNGDGNFKKYLPASTSNSMRVDPVDAKEVCLTIASFNPNKACGPSSVPSYILYYMQNELANPLAKIVNISLSTGIHPDKLKIAKITPIYKKGSKLSTSNYRPISLLSNINKLIERLVYNRVFDFANKQNLFYKLQFGFRPKHSTAHALTNITEEIRNSLDRGKFSCAVFVDFQKAFDTVNHSVLLAKLEHYGIRGTINKWFESYLSNRKHSVTINGFDSDLHDANHGVPQGSVLGPLLFLIYINDLYRSIKFSKTYHFADDTNLLITDKKIKSIQAKLNKDLKGLYKWLLANKISLNAAKTELVIFRKPSWSLPITKIKIAGVRISPSHSTKYLGVYLDEFLNGSAHCKHLSTILRRANGMIAKARHHLRDSPEYNRTLYHSIFSSHMTYGCLSWFTSENQYTKRIEILQNNALRLITFAVSFRDHITPTYKELKILKIKDHVTMEQLLLVHDFLNNKLPSSFDGSFILARDQYDLGTRAALLDKLFLPITDTVRYGTNSIKIQAIKSWNELIDSHPTHEIVSLSRNKFKRLVMKHFIENY